MKIDLDQLTSIVEDVTREAMAELRIPGVALGIIQRGADRQVSLGVTNIDHPLEVTPQTVFQIGSISKIFLGTAAMRLVESGSVTLDDPVRTWVPELRLADPEATRGVTLRHLLTHTGGWLGDYTDDTGRGDDALRRMVDRLADAPQVTRLGEHYHYSNLGYVLAGHALAQAAGKPYESIVTEQVITPLGLEHTAFFPEDVISRRVAAGHYVGRKRIVVTPWSRPRSRGPNGGVLSCVEDLLRFARFHLGDGSLEDGSRHLSAASMRAMQEPGPITGVEGESRGLSWALSRRYGIDLVEHGGTTDGFQSAMWLFPRHDAGIIALTNADRGHLLRDRLVRALRETLCGGPLPCPTSLDFSAAQLTEYTGVYAASGVLNIRSGSSDRLKLTLWNGSIDDPTDSMLAPVGDDRVEAMDGILRGHQGDFLRDGEGRIELLRWNGSRAFRRYEHGEAIPGIEELARSRAAMMASLDPDPE
jgi:CubicO group peptidase (beta-lactamase class C family)